MRSHSNRWLRMGFDALILRVKGFLAPGRMLRWEAFQAGVYITPSSTCTCLPAPAIVAFPMRLVLISMGKYNIIGIGIGIGIGGYEYSLSSIDDKRSQAGTLAIASFQG